MKKLLILAAIALTALEACERSDAASEQEPVSEKAKQALEVMYPGASNVCWQSKKGYVVATFTNAPVRSPADQLNAWFDNQGTWYMTETEIRFDQLPEAVKTAFAAGTYATWQVDEVDKIERNGTEIVFVIEVKQSGREMDLYYSPDGVLIKELADVDDDYDYEDYIPSGQNPSIESFLKTNYPNARILEIEREGNYTEVELLDGNVKRELIFDSGNNWLHTKTELVITEVPETIMQVLQASEYASYRIDDAAHYKTVDSEYYRFELEAASGDVKVEITTTGILTVVGYESDDDDGYPGPVNQSCSDFIAKHYPGAQIVESEYEKGYLEVEIWHEGREKTVRFNASNEWVDTHWDIRARELPQAVKDAIAASEYASYEIDDVEFFQTPSGDYYEVELEKGEREATMRIKTDGSVI